MTNAMVCDEVPTKCAASDASDRIPAVTQRNLQEPWPFVLPRVSAIRLGKSLVPAWRPRGPARRHRICWVTFLPDLLVFISLFHVFWRNDFRIWDAPDRFPGVTQRNLKEPFPFVLPRVFAIRLCKSLVPAWRPRGAARRHRIWWEVVLPDLHVFQ